jgi:hypothetical protein
MILEFVISEVLSPFKITLVFKNVKEPRLEHLVYKMVRWNKMSDLIYSLLVYCLACRSKGEWTRDIVCTECTPFHIA